MKKKLIAFIFFIFLPLSTFATPDTSINKNNPNAMIESDLSAFADSWNHGEINGVIQHYKKGDKTTLIWAHMVHGYSNIATYLKKTYPKDAMGTLSTNHVAIHLLSSNYALVTGNWLIKQNNGKTEGGPFSMLYENTSAGWKVILDHGSRT